MATKHYLFSYGTLQFEQVQIETYGRKLKGQKDRLFNFTVQELEITDPEVLRKSQQKFHPIAIQTDNEHDFIEGYVFEINEEELLQTDRYEVADYQRALQRMGSGKEAWIYIKK